MEGVALSRTTRALRRPWFALWRLIENMLYTGRSYTLHVPYGQRIYTPWFDVNRESDFTRAMHVIRSSGPLTVSPDRCYMLYQLARRSLTVPGDVAECGVYKGSTAQLLAWVLSSEHTRGRRLHLFDTFRGMPDDVIAARDYHSPGDFGDTSVDYVRGRLGHHVTLCDFHPGLIPDTLADVSKIASYAFVHVDVDIYPAVMDCCRWFWPRLSPGGIMVFDDYGFYPYRLAARAAVDEFFAKEIDQPLVMPTGQAVLIKTAP